MSTHPAGPLIANRLVDRVAYEPALDGLRGLAAVAVFAVHLEQNSLIQGGAGPFSVRQLFINGRYGVAIFFLLTGYFLARPLWMFPVSERLDRALRGFWRRRLAKILPLYWLVLISLLIMHQNDASDDHFFDALVHALCLHNLWPQTLYSISEPFWAIAVIVQYYVFFWIAIASLARITSLTDRVLSIVLVSICTAGWATNMAVEHFNLLGKIDPIIWRHSLLIHLPIFSLGALLAAYGRPSSPPRIASGFWDATALASAVILLLLWSSPAAERMEWIGSRYGYPLLPALLCMILLAATRDGLTRQLLSLRLLVLLGVISYGFYLLHLPVLRVVKRGMAAMPPEGNAAFILGLATFITTCLLSWVLARAIEMPLRSRTLTVSRTSD